MKRMLWIGNPFFHRDMEEFGWDVTYRFPEDDIITWEDCLALSGKPPDMLVVADISRPPFVLGVEHFPCPTAFYAVDTHIHSWMPWYAQAFDVCLVSLKDHIPDFQKGRLTAQHIFWSPPYLPGEAIPPDSTIRDLDISFVGTLNPEIMPMRSAFIDELKDAFPGMWAGWGSFAKQYPLSKIVINTCEHGDLNFRVFESMGLGAALVTPAIGNGQTDLFTPEYHLLTYEIPDSPEPEQRGREAARRAAKQIERLLADDAMRLAIARAGYREVSEKHLSRHRAGRFDEIIRNIDRAEVENRLSLAPAIRDTYLKLIYLHWAEHTNPLRQQAYLNAARGTL